MVKTGNDVLDINPLERMEKLEDIGNEKRGTIAAKKKELEDLERLKKKEIEELDQKRRKDMEDLDKRKQKDIEELDKKRKELKEFETKKMLEIEETEQLIERSFQELMRHKRIILQEEKEKGGKVSDEEISLEETAKSAPDVIPQDAGPNYSKFFENLQAPQRLYDVTNNGFYNGLTELRNKASTGQITPEEELFVEKLRGQFEQFTQNQGYIEQKDQNQYVRRSMNIIDQIGQYHKLRID